MNNQAFTPKLLNRICLILISVVMAGGLSAIFLTSLAQADSPIYVRPGGDDTACIGIVNVDYQPSVAPLCAVKTLPRALSLAGTANSIIFDTGSRTITLPPPTSSSGFGDISATAAVTLEVSKTDFPDPVLVENSLTYTVRIDNMGDMNATGVLLIDSLPQVGVVSVKSITTTQGICNPPDIFNLISCPLGNLDASDSATVTIVVTPTAAGNISNIAIARDAGSAADLVTETTRVEGVTNLAVSKTDDPDPVTLGQPLTYTIIVTNSGPSAAATVDLTDDLPAGATFGSVTPSQGSCSNGSVVTCALGLMGHNATATVRIVVTPTTIGLITNTVTVSGGDIDPDLSNNVFTESTTIQGGPTGPGTIFLPIILKNFTNPTISMYWNDWETVRDKVSQDDDGAGLTPDGLTDGLFRVTVNMGSQTKTIDSVILTTSQSPGIYWDTISTTSAWVLGVFDGGTRLNNDNGTITQTISGVLGVTLYASDVDPLSPLYSLFPPDTHTYTVTVHFTDSSSLSASARIPPEGSPPPPPPPPSPPPSPPCEPMAELTVGSQPRGVVVDEARNRVYVANYGSDSVSVIDSSSNTVLRTITGVTTANGMTLDPGRNILWVTNHSTNQVTPIQNPDSASYTLLSPVAVGGGPWGVAYVNNNVYVVNNSGNSVTIINAATLAATPLSGSFNRPYHIAANPNTGKVYVTNFGNHTVTVINGTTVSSVVNLNVLDPSTQPYGVAVDETRELIYVATVDSHRVVAIGRHPETGAPDRLLGWAAFHRGFGDPARPVPMRAIAVNPDIGPISPMDDGGHIWTTTSTADGSEANQALLIPKGWTSYFHFPVPCNVGINPSEGIAINRSLDRAYVAHGTNSGTLSVFDDEPVPPLVPFSATEGIGFEIFTVE